MSDLYDILVKEDLFLNEKTQTGTDKFVKHPYQYFYEEVFKDFREKSISLLEIGVYHGASAIIWDKYFTKAKITLLDIEPRKSIENIKNRVDESRTQILICDAYEKDVSDKLGNFDIIIDDGPHSLISMQKCIELYLNKLNPNGILIIEDIPDRNWIDILISPLNEKKYEIVDFPQIGKYNCSFDSRILAIWK